MIAHQLLQRMLRNTVASDIGNATADIKLTALEAANGVLLELFDILPTHFKRGKHAALVSGGVTVAVTGLSHGSRATSTAFASYIGCSVVLPGTTVINQIMDSDEVLYPFTGTASSGNATVYVDAVTLAEDVDRLTVTPALIDPSNMQNPVPLDLVPSTMIGFPNSGPWDDARISSLNAARPSCYRVLEMASSNPATATAPSFLIKVFPRPDAEYIIEFAFELAPVMLGILDFTVLRTLPIRDQAAWGGLLEMAEAAMCRTKYWNQPQLTKAVMDAGERARASLKRRFAVSIATPQNKIGSPLGW